MKTPLSPRANKSPTKPHFVLGIVCDKVCSSSIARMMRDTLQLASASGQSGYSCYVYLGAGLDDLKPLLSAARVMLTPNVEAVTHWRSYFHKPEDQVSAPTEVPTDYVKLEPPPADNLYLRKDTEFPAKMNYSDPIETNDSNIPWNPPSHIPGNPFQQDF